MIIEYEKNKYVTEIKQLEITDSKNVFLKGKNMYDLEYGKIMVVYL